MKILKDSRGQVNMLGLGIGVIVAFITIGIVASIWATQNKTPLDATTITILGLATTFMALVMLYYLVSPLLRAGA